MLIYVDIVEREWYIEKKGGFINTASCPLTANTFPNYVVWRSRDFLLDMTTLGPAEPCVM